MADPVTIGTLALSAAGSATSAMGSLAAGKAALTQGQYAQAAGLMQKRAADAEATQIEQNATTEFAAGQRRALESGTRARLAGATSLARAAGSGVDVGSGSPVENRSQLAGRGEYQALMDMFNGANAATGLRNQATGVRFGGSMAELGGNMALIGAQQQQSASRLSAFGTLASGLGQGLGQYGYMTYPTRYGAPGVLT